jgi:hypothetical protein
MTLEKFERAFSILISRARELPAALMEEAGEGLPAEVAGDDFPTSTVLRFQVVANVEYEAALTLLLDEVTAVSAEIILRGLLEACAHLHYIAVGSDQKERTCRAIRTELGMAIAIENLSRQFIGMDTTERKRLSAEAESRKTLLKTRQSRLGCKGKPRDYSNVGDALKEMVKLEPDLDWAIDLYLSATMLAHQQNPDRLIRDIGGGANDVVFPSHSLRCARFDHILVTYGLLSQRFYQVVKPGQAPDGFLTALQSQRTDDLIQRGMEGAFD